MEKVFVDYSNKSLMLSVAQYCPNPKKPSIIDDELGIWKTIFSSCQHLESTKVWCDSGENEKGLLDVVAKYSPKKFLWVEGL